MAFALYFPIVIPCPLERVLTYFNVCTTLEVLVLRKMICFLGDTNNDFSIVAVILFAFYFRLNIFTRFQIFCWKPLEAEGEESCEC